MTNVTVQVPERLAKELNEASEEFIAEMIELGLRTRKIEQAVAQYAWGDDPWSGCPLGRHYGR